MGSNLWNEDGSARRPEPGQGEEIRAFADLVADIPEPGEESFMSYARLQQAAKAATPAGIGDIVHYWHEDACYAAIVTRDGVAEVHPDGLFVFSDLPNMSGTVTATHDERKGRDTWHWPESL